MESPGSQVHTGGEGWTWHLALLPDESHLTPPKRTCHQEAGGQQWRGILGMGD